MRELYIYHHMGLGDHLICHGIIRHYANEYDVVHNFVKPHNFKSVSFMYRDLKNVDLIEGYDQDAEKYTKNVLKIGFDNLFYGGNTFDKGFYEQIGLPFENRWELFKIERDIKKEKTIYNEYNITGNYNFVHDDSRFPIPLQYKNNSVSPRIGLTENIFDYLTLIEKADEIHCIESSFLFMIDSVIKGKKVFVHRSSRWNPSNEIPHYSNKNEYIIL